MTDRYVAADGDSAAPPASLPGRLAGLVDLIASLDTRVIAALDALDDMHATIARFDTLAAQADVLATDLRGRLERLDARVNADLDEIKAAILAALGDVHLASFEGRFDRLEEAVFNIERATVNLDRAFEGGLEMLPDFVTRRLKREGAKVAPDTAGDAPPPS